MSDVYKQYQPPVSGGLFLKLEEGDAVKIRIASQPYIFNNEYKGQVSTRYAWVVYNYDQERAQIFHQGVTGYRTIANLASDPDWGDPSGFDVRVSRHGLGTDTKYNITPLPSKADLDDKQTSAVNEVDLPKHVSGAILLSEFVGGKGLPETEQSGDSQESDIELDVEDDGYFESLLDDEPQP